VDPAFSARSLKYEKKRPIKKEADKKWQNGYVPSVDIFTMKKKQGRHLQSFRTIGYVPFVVQRKVHSRRRISENRMNERDTTKKSTGPAVWTGICGSSHPQKVDPSKIDHLVSNHVVLLIKAMKIKCVLEEN
jgi:hypothetical protein